MTPLLERESQPRHRHSWEATLYDGRWVEYCRAGCGIPWRRARIDRSGKPIALRRKADRP